MLSEKGKRVLRGLDYAWRLIVLFAGIGSMFCGAIALVANEEGDEEVFIGAIVLLIGGVVGLLPFILKRLRDRRRVGFNGKPVETEDLSRLSRKERFVRYMHTLLRVIYLIMAGYLLFVSLIEFLCSEKEVGFVFLVVGLVFVGFYSINRRRARQRAQAQPDKAGTDAAPRSRWNLIARIREWDAELLAEESIYTDKHIHRCLNCGHEYEGYYCPNCGQDHRTDTIDWHQLIIGMLSEAVNFDGSTIRTLYEMVRHPAVVFRRYLSGQHERYCNPMKFLLFSGIAFALMSIIFPSEESIGFTATGNKVYEVFSNFAGNIVVFQCLLAFLVDFFPLYWAFKRTAIGKKLNQVDFYIVMLYLMGMDFFLRACFCPLTHMDHDWNMVRWLILFFYQFVVLKQFFELSIWEMIKRYFYRYVLYIFFIVLSIIPFLALDFYVTGDTEYTPIADYVFSVLTGGVLSPEFLAEP